MKKLVLLVALVSLMFGCTSINMKYHHADEKNDGYWMTVTTTNKMSGEAKAGLWYCQSIDKNAPVCVQAKMKACTGSDCQLQAPYGITDSQIDNPSGTPIIKHVGPEK